MHKHWTAQYYTENQYLKTTSLYYADDHISHGE